MEGNVGHVVSVPAALTRQSALLRILVLEDEPGLQSDGRQTLIAPRSAWSRIRTRRRSSRVFGSRVLSRAWRLTSCILSGAILRRSNLLLESFMEFFDLLMGLRLDARDVIPRTFEMGDDLIELHVEGRSVPVREFWRMNTISKAPPNA
jgi:hypothetical protein